MSTNHPTPSTGGHARWYQIRIQGHPDQRWSVWFDGLALSHDGTGSTVLEGSVVDQSALHELLSEVRDLGMPLISVIHEETRTEGNTP